MFNRFVVGDNLFKISTLLEMVDELPNVSVNINAYLLRDTKYKWV